MFARKLLCLILALSTVLSIGTVCFAEDTTEVRQAFITGRSLDVFIDGSMNPDSLSCRISNQSAELTDCGFLADEGVAVRTTLLLDCSRSVPEQMREQVRLFIDSMIEHIGEGEQYRIVSFAKETRVLQEFTADRYDLSKAAESLVFDGSQSRLYDAIYSTLQQPELSDGKPCFYRTVVITDGVDKAAGGITKEELLLELQNRMYPIEIVCVSLAEQEEPAKQLSALTRISGGRYVNFYSGAQTAQLWREIAADENMLHLRVTVPDELLDGSVRQIDITDGTHNVCFDLKLPIPGEELPPMTQNSDEPTAEATTETVEAKAEGGFMSFIKENLLVVVIAAGVLLAAIAAVIIIVAVTSGRKKRAGQDSAPASQPTRRPARQPVSQPPVSDATELVGVGRTGSVSVRFVNVNNPSQFWDASVSAGGALILGREQGCQVHIDDKSVSRQQCRLYLGGGNAVYVENLSGSNITMLNGQPLSTPSALENGAQLKCGRLTLMVELNCSAGGINQMTQFVNV